MGDYRPRGERAKVICTACGVTLLERSAALGPGTGLCTSDATKARKANPALPTASEPVPGTRALRRRAFGVNRSRAGRLGPSQRRHAKALGVIVP